MKCYGNEIRDFGGPTTSNQHHTFYISNRTGTPVAAYELAFNYLHDNEAGYGLHLFDEGDCGGYTGAFLVHHNVILEQNRAAFHTALCTNNGTEPMPIYFYSNLISDISTNDDWVIEHAGRTNKSAIYHYNNTIYGYINNAVPEAGIFVYGSDGSFPFSGTWGWHNNLMYDLNNINYFTTHAQNTKADDPDTSGNNAYYNGGDGNPSGTPSWDTSPLTSDPDFVGIVDKNFQPQTAAYRTGGTTLLGKPFAAYGVNGSLLQNGSGIYIGAYGDTEAVLVYPSPPTELQVVD